MDFYFFQKYRKIYQLIHFYPHFSYSVNFRNKIYKLSILLFVDELGCEKIQFESNLFPGNEHLWVNKIMHLNCDSRTEYSINFEFNKIFLTFLDLYRFVFDKKIFDEFSIFFKNTEKFNN